MKKYLEKPLPIIKKLRQNISEQTERLIYKPSGGTKEKAVSKEDQNKQKLSNGKILEPAKIYQKNRGALSPTPRYRMGLDKEKYILSNPHQQQCSKNFKFLISASIKF